MVRFSESCDRALSSRGARGCFLPCLTLVVETVGSVKIAGARLVSPGRFLGCFVNRLLAPSPALSDLIRDIGVEEVTHSGVVARFVLPELGTVSADDRMKLLEHVKTHWAELKQDNELVSAFKEVRRGGDGRE